ncbi:hypothetical protein HJB82_12140 [Rhizobium sp. NZLR10]|uniref:hypothetical protein n=1 Tax=Rhizobium sp. NZLR10 TaxID=2731097 RepID=UPI001C83A145|nr:hypothetical protein [Rhizobium sp. NZLR10]MBX5196064.1 hypothetical protein [Rhizobium sp. NZLR10]
MSYAGVEGEGDMRDERAVRAILTDQGQEGSADIPHRRIIHAATDSQIIQPSPV